MKKGRIIETARRLRRDMIDAERKVWTLLRQPPFAEHRFRRQVPFDRYVADLPHIAGGWSSRSMAASI